MLNNFTYKRLARKSFIKMTFLLYTNEPYVNNVTFMNDGH